MSSRYLHLVRMDVAHDLEPTFNEVYDTEHVPLLQAVPGIVRATRYRSPSPTDPGYIAAYELETRRCCRAPNGRRRARPAAGQGDPAAHDEPPHRHVRVGGQQCRPHLPDAVRLLGLHGRGAAPRGSLQRPLRRRARPAAARPPGCTSVARFRTVAAGEPRYLAAYEVDRTDLPMSKLWNDTSDIGRWKPEVRPYTYNKHYIVAERIWPRS